MRVTLELSNNIQTLSPEKQKEKLLQALQTSGFESKLIGKREMIF